MKYAIQINVCSDIQRNTWFVFYDYRFGDMLLRFGYVPDSIVDIPRLSGDRLVTPNRAAGKLMAPPFPAYAARMR